MPEARLARQVNNEGQSRSDPQKPLCALLRSEIRLVGSRKMRVLLGEVVVLIVMLHILGADTFFP
jgi:hypothetical protein